MADKKTGMSGRKTKISVQDLVELLRLAHGEIQQNDALSNGKKAAISKELDTAVVLAVRTALAKTYRDIRDADDIILSTLDMDLSDAAKCVDIPDWAAAITSPAANPEPAEPERNIPDAAATEKTVTSPRGYQYRLIPAWPMSSCVACGRKLDGGYMAICPDCGGLFCEDCVTNGTFDSHNCDGDEG